VSNFREPADILQIAPANVDVEEDHIAVFLLSLNEVAELRFNVEESLRQSLARSDTVHSQIDRGDPRSSDFIDERLVQQVAIGGKIHEKTVLSSVPYHVEDKILAKQRLPAHQRNDTATEGFEPVHSAFRRVQVHTGQPLVRVVVILEAVVAVFVTAPLGEEVAENRSEFIGVNAGVEIRNGPTAEGASPIDGFVEDCLHPGFLL